MFRCALILLSKSSSQFARPLNTVINVQTQLRREDAQKVACQFIIAFVLFSNFFLIHPMHVLSSLPLRVSIRPNPASPHTVMIRRWTALARHRALSTAPASSGLPDIATGAKKPELDERITQKPPVYRLPHYGAPEEEIGALPDSAVARALRVYGGLMRARDDATVLRDRLMRATRADYLCAQLTMNGVVVSDKMDKSVVVAARRAAYSSKLHLKYWKTRRFMAHDELNLCREGDRVIIRSCRPLSKHKAYVVVENYGDSTRLGEDERAKEIAAAVAEDAADEATGDEEGNKQ